MEKYSELRDAIENIDLIDTHAHNIVSLNSTFPFIKCFTEADGDEALSYAPHSLSFKRSLRDLADLYECDKSLDGVETCRQGLGLSLISDKCFEAAKIYALLIDDGIEFDQMHDLEWHRNFVPFVGRIVRIETLAEKILNGEIPDESKWTLDMFAKIFTKMLNSYPLKFCSTVADKAVGLKSIAAYRSGLEIDPYVTKMDAEEGLVEVLSSVKPVRIQNKSLIDFIFMLSLDVALCFNLPVQIHTGFGDRDLDLRLSNPLHLRAVLEEKKYSKCCFVLLHASYPFSKEASYLACVYPQVYLDFGLAVPKLSVHGMISCVKELLEIAPIKKVMFSTDGYAFPETFYLGAKRARAVLLSVLCDACDDGDLTTHEAVEAIEDIFKQNAARLYKIKADFSCSKIDIPRNPAVFKSNDSHQNTVLVRIIWVDTSGQHRCREMFFNLDLIRSDFDYRLLLVVNRYTSSSHLIVETRFCASQETRWGGSIETRVEYIEESVERIKGVFKKMEVTLGEIFSLFSYEVKNLSPLFKNVSEVHKMYFDDKGLAMVYDEYSDDYEYLGPFIDGSTKPIFDDFLEDEFKSTNFSGFVDLFGNFFDIRFDEGLTLVTRQLHVHYEAYAIVGFGNARQIEDNVVVPARRFYDVVRKNGVGLSVACMAISSSCDGVADGTNLTAVGEIRLIPDLSTKWKIPWAEQEEMVLADMQLKPGEPWDYCPREALRRVSKVLKDEFNLEMDAGFENEFYLLKNVIREGKEEWVPFDSTPYCSTSAFDAASSLFQEMNLALQSIHISAEQFHAESGKGQFEIALGHTVCIHAADNLVLAREVIRAIARKHGLLATFTPKYSLEDVGSGCHVHISLLENGMNVFMGSGGSSQYGMSKVGKEFMAGVFYHLPSIMAFTAPLPNSYDRIQPNTWSGAYHCWGKENREAPLRTACPPGISDTVVSNFEIKAFDGCANPHLGLASIVASGIDGLRRNLSLPEPIGTNPFSLHGKVQRLPTKLSESVEALEKDIFLKDFIGEKLVTAVIGVRKADNEFFTKNKDAYKQLIHKY
ncbi:hypothetical protein GIB67_017207 [Kingdonia uniflora]|uniref:GS catalytic domain-containing protein n=1 Tax=Kingdonia uniflora TaxID=39325 RepID=A0A7J7NL80_9MAGN|nr:hypothetical protein GIB67_017207 [Kingdonia uniflora]